VAEAGKGAGRAFTSFVERVTSRRVQSTPKAYLVVLEGDVNVGRSLEIYGDTPIGRSKQYAELLFQQNDEQSPISRLHCTIVDEESHFTLRDEDSANGTYLNSVRLEPLVAEELHDGDEIELSQVERGGVKLLFQIAQDFDTGTTNMARTTNPSMGRVLSLDDDDDFDDLDDFGTGDQF
jgi:predicted component of type VI protein secretion system